MPAAPETESAPPPEEPKSLLDRFGAAFPIALTAIATAFAGMSTNELQQAMFWRSAAAQDQAKATNQWTLAGFKRDRSLIMQSTAATLHAQAGYAASFRGGDPISSAGSPDAADHRRAVDWLAGKGPPPAKLPDVTDAQLKDLLKAIQEREPEGDLLKKAARVSQATINAAIDEAEKTVERTDREWDPTIKAAAKLIAGRTEVKPDAPDRSARVAEATAAQAAGFELEQRRYRAEATLNQGVGYLYEARVKVSTAESDRHRERSKNFFYAMLAAQVGATISSLALARRKKSALWLLAGLSGVVAVLIGGYVYVEM
ncbi:MAG: hypothetical protein JWO38_575 [Gemmataceae bacterium]|nr:hypothetical protein [Gemmataceae bacterium]